MVTGETVRILIIACGVPGVEEERVRKAAELARRLISKSCRGNFQSS
jgi:DNA/RNA-binding domain of Phe-tRNA-synthetase-like protein